jgi:P27 family predicted phage terminase small subunit
MLADHNHHRRHLRRSLIVFHGVHDTATERATEAGPGASIEVPPVLIDEIAIAEWQRVAPMLARNGSLTALQQTLLVGYCATLAKAMRAEDVVAREGAYYEVKTGSGGMMMRRHPAVIDAEKSWNALRQFARQLGITASRQRTSPASEQRRAVFK